MGPASGRGWVCTLCATVSRPLCSFFVSSRRRHTRCSRDWSSDVCSSDLWLSESGATIRVAQDLLGQSDMETTLRVYTHSVPDSKRRAIANVAALLFPSVPPEGKIGRASCRERG